MATMLKTTPPSAITGFEETRECLSSFDPPSWPSTPAIVGSPAIRTGHVGADPDNIEYDTPVFTITTW